MIWTILLVSNYYALIKYYNQIVYFISFHISHMVKSSVDVIIRSSKYHLYLTDSEYNSIVNALINLKNPLSKQAKYTDGVDKIVLTKKFKVK